MKNGNACRYVINFPGMAGEYDQIVLKVPKLKDATLTTVDTLKFKAENFKEADLLEG